MKNSKTKKLKARSQPLTPYQLEKAYKKARKEKKKDPLKRSQDCG